MRLAAVVVLGCALAISLVELIGVAFAIVGHHKQERRAACPSAPRTTAILGRRHTLTEASRTRSARQPFAKHNALCLGASSALDQAAAPGSPIHCP
jgi:hypothetical protein